MTPARRLPAPARYVPYREARRQPHVIVDGAPLPTTTFTLSHWPNNNTPDVLRRDTSTATVFAWLDDPAFHRVPGVAEPLAVSNNHFDEDGLFSVFAMTAPELAMAYRGLLIDASFAGDFGRFRERSAARLCFAIEAMTDPATSPLPVAVFRDPDPVAALYRALLAELPALLAEVNRYEPLWRDQDRHLGESLAWLGEGTVTVRDQPDMDLAVVGIPPGLPSRTVRRYLRNEAAVVHPFAVNSRTDRSRLLRIQGGGLEFEYRYESWLRLASRRAPLRVRLDEARRHLNALEGDDAWIAEEPTDIVPRLKRVDGSPSRLTPEAFLQVLRTAFTSAPVAWDPYEWPAARADDWPAAATPRS